MAIVIYSVQCVVLVAYSVYCVAKYLYTVHRVSFGDFMQYAVKFVGCILWFFLVCWYLKSCKLWEKKKKIHFCWLIFQYISYLQHHKWTLWHSCALPLNVTRLSDFLSVTPTTPVVIYLIKNRNTFVPWQPGTLSWTK